MRGGDGAEQDDSKKALALPIYSLLRVRAILPIDRFMNALCQKLEYSCIIEILSEFTGCGAGILIENFKATFTTGNSGAKLFVVQLHTLHFRFLKIVPDWLFC